MKLLVAIVIGIIGPVAFLAATTVGLISYEQEAVNAGASSLQEVCQLLIAAEGDNADCRELLVYYQVQPFAAAALAAGIGLPLVNWLLPFILGRHRAALGNIYSALFPVALITSLVLAIFNVSLVLVSLHIFSTWTAQVIYPFAYIAVGLGALVIFGAIIKATLGTLRSNPMVEYGVAVSPREVPKLARVIEKMATELGAKPPKNVILGAAPKFYITNANMLVMPSKQKLSGETVYLSATLVRLLTEEELEAVVAHELMHYRGDDLAYTQKFYPIYKALANFQNRLALTESALAVPLAANIAVLEDSFSRSERRISRERELEADRGASEAVSGNALASALMKMSTFAAMWSLALQDNKLALERGDFINNAVDAIRGYAVYECDQRFIDDQRAKALQMRTSHPTDTHPTLQERMDALGLSAADLEADYFSSFDDGRHFEIDLGPDHIQALTQAFHVQTAATYPVTIPAADDRQAEHQRFLNDLVYQIVERFIWADDELDAEEVKAAEAVARTQFPSFNPLVFRERLHGDYEPRDIEALASAVGKLFTHDGLDRIEKIIGAVISADGHVDEKEQEMRDVFLRVARETADSMTILKTEPAE